jgi:hypothetical protein
MTWPQVTQFETNAVEAELRAQLRREQRAARAQSRPHTHGKRAWRGLAVVLTGRSASRARAMTPAARSCARAPVLLPEAGDCGLRCGPIG